MYKDTVEKEANGETILTSCPEKETDIGEDKQLQNDEQEREQELRRRRRRTSQYRQRSELRDFSYRQLAQKKKITTSEGINRQNNYQEENIRRGGTVQRKKQMERV